MATVAEYLNGLRSFLKAGGRRGEKASCRDEDLAAFLKPCYVIRGAEPYFARQFVDTLRDLLFEPGSPEFNVVRFWMDETKWVEVIDAARTTPSFFSPWRLVVAEYLPEGETRAREKKEEEKEEEEEEEDEEQGKNKKAKAAPLDAYLQSPLSLPGAILIVICPAGFRGAVPSPVLRAIAPGKTSGRTAAPDSVVVLEMPALKKGALSGWIDDEAGRRGFSLTKEAKSRLAEVCGSDLLKLMNELDKLQAYAAEKVASGAAVSAEDIDKVCAWTKDLEGWNLTDALSSGAWPRCALVLDKLFMEGEPGQKILGQIGGFLRDVRLARALLEEKQMSRKEVFSRLKPNIKENFYELYEKKFKDFFHPVDRLSRTKLRDLFLELSRQDAALKSGADAPRERIEAFVYDCCRAIKEGEIRRTARG
ncbi:MAG: DNA polymerase III subunit delta [Candidatus Aminicenantes bacterium]|nr:DNA polymerase III subunit delta [Candidatus Aminicenantes bacterium]